MNIVSSPKRRLSTFIFPPLKQGGFVFRIVEAVDNRCLLQLSHGRLSPCGSYPSKKWGECEVITIHLVVTLQNYIRLDQLDAFSSKRPFHIT